MMNVLSPAFEMLNAAGTATATTATAAGGDPNSGSNDDNSSRIRIPNAREETPPLVDPDDFSAPGGVGSKRTADQAGLATAAATSRTGSSGRKAPVPVSVTSAPPKPPTSLIQLRRTIERRRIRNSKQARRTRLRKKLLLESMQEQVEELRGELSALKSVIRRELPGSAARLLKDAGDGPEGDDGAAGGPGTTTSAPRLPVRSVTITDPSLPDNPIVFASEGFLSLTGYDRDQVVGRNFRFLQGPGTDQAAVDVMRRKFREGNDMSMCLLNYKEDGTPFWNHFFVVALKDDDGNVMNFLGLHCDVSRVVVKSFSGFASKATMA